MNAARPTVLFVDDEERILRSLRLLFRQRADVLVSTSGAEALEMVGKRSVHVVVSDQRMPGMTGVELLRGVRERSPQSMRVLLTGYADLSAIVASVNEGEIFRFVDKPWDAPKLIDVVEQAARIAMASAPAIAAPAIAIATTARPAIAVPAPATVPAAHVLLLDADPGAHEMLRDLAPPGVAIHHAPALEQALAILADTDIDVLVADLPPGGEVSAALKTLKRYSPDTQTIVIAHIADARVLIGLINQGQIFRFLPKPLSRELLRRSLQAAFERRHTLRALPVLRQRHVVEGDDLEAAGGLSSKLLGYWRRMRERSKANA